MKDTTKIKGATYTDDISGLKLDTSKQYTIQDIYFFKCQTRDLLNQTYKLPFASRALVSCEAR